MLKRVVISTMRRILLPALLIAAVMLASPGSTAENVVLSVNDARGEAGKTVGITVSISGLSGLPGSPGISGGQFELFYDAGVALAAQVRPGSLVGNNFTFASNPQYSGNSVMVAWAGTGEPLTEDGDLCNITFTLNRAGSINPSIGNIVIYDRDMRPLAVESVTVDHPGEAEPIGEQAAQEKEEEKEEENAPAGETPGEDRNTPGEGGAQENRSRLLLSLLAVALATTAGVMLYFHLRRRK